MPEQRKIRCFAERFVGQGNTCGEKPAEGPQTKELDAALKKILADREAQDNIYARNRNVVPTSSK